MVVIFPLFVLSTDLGDYLLFFNYLSLTIN